MRLLQRSRRTPRAKTIRPAEAYIAAGAEEARRLGHGYIGTEHILLALARNPEGDANRLLARLGAGSAAVEQALACWLPDRSPNAKIDPQALATLGIDLDNVRERLDERFGAGALERTRSGCLGICPRVKLALAYALDAAGDRTLGDEHVLLGMLSVPDSVAARTLSSLGVSLEDAKAILAKEQP
jgi:ATP-dependent Clp protease ATP-binding subunit ClpA